MVMQTRRTPKRPNKPEEENPEPLMEVQQAESEEQVNTGSLTKDSKAKTRAEARRKTREDLRLKNLGLGLKIDVTEAQTNRKIKFTDDVLDQEPEDDKGMDESGDDDEDSDDDIEEVKGSSAREKALEQRAVERENAQVKMLEKKPQKKRVKQVEARRTEIDDSDDDFDEAFFQELDSELAIKRQEKKIALKIEPKGKHIAFVSEDGEVKKPIQADHNIELVVLERDNISVSRAAHAALGTAPSEAAIIFSRGNLMHGKDTKQSISKKRQKNKTIVTSWKRSTKMNRIMFANKGKVGRGRPAAHFVVHS